MLLTSKKGGRRLKVTDFLLRWSNGRKPRQSPDEQLSILRAFAAKHNAALENNQKRRKKKKG